MKYSDFPHPDMPTSFDVVQQYGDSFFYMAIAFNFVVQVRLTICPPFLVTRTLLF